VDVTDLLARVQAPTLVLHARNDEVTAIDEARLLAAGIAKAEFVELDSRNHILLEHEPAWRRFQEAVLDFMGVGGRAADESVFASLSSRERQVLALMTEGLSNTDIAERLAISEKTVRNHSSNIFDKLGCWSRAQAIVFARDHAISINPKPPKPRTWDLELGIWMLGIWVWDLTRSRSHVFVKPLDRAVPGEVGRGLVVALRRRVVVEAVHRALVDVPFVRYARRGQRLVVIRPCRRPAACRARLVHEDGRLDLRDVRRHRTAP
jgi:DNA-binding CsgD family transcriptional regulator